MTTFRLKRHGNVDLEFDGEVIAESSSNDGTKDRWQVLRLYRTTVADRPYVLERLGESRLPDEVTMRHVDVYPSAHDVRLALERKREGTNERNFTIVAMELLDAAAKTDPAFSADAVERLA